ncbi:MAG TPA: hypothetical protein VKC34_14930 [Blastocatellia bacterium]|nr:hypothetical protein [Blastocatellia bacterium]
MASAIQKYFLSAPAPNTAAGFIDDNFAVVDMKRGRRGFGLAASAVTQLPPGLVAPGFETPNIEDEEELAGIVEQTAGAAGLMRKKRWSVALPEGTARTLIIILESKPGSRRELDEVLAWKIERLIAARSSELRISRQRISPSGGLERYLVTVAREDVLSQYDSLFNRVGWNAGLMLPRHLGEAQWLMWDQAPGDKMLVSANRSGFTSVIVRKGEPVLVRNYVCEPESRADEIHRFALYYKDRLTDSPDGSGLTGLLVLGGIDPSEAGRAVSDALDGKPHIFDPSEFGFSLENEPIGFDQLAGAAGLATIAWQK